MYIMIIMNLVDYSKSKCYLLTKLKVNRQIKMREEKQGSNTLCLKGSRKNMNIPEQ